jgi:hypothetical protein
MAIYNPHMMDPHDMQKLSDFLSQKRPLSPDTDCYSFPEVKRRVTTVDKPVLKVNTMVLPRETPQLLHLPTSGSLLVKASAAYSDTMGYPTSLNQPYQSIETQYTETMHSVLSANQLRYHSEVGFLESCRTSVESSSSCSIFSSLSGLSSSQNPFGDLSGTMPTESQSSLSTLGEVNKDDVNVVIVRLRRLQNVLAEQSGILEEALQILQGQRRA